MIDEKVFNHRLKNVPESQLNKLFSIASELEGVISLGVGEPDFDTPWQVRSEAIYHLEKGDTFYTDNSGLLELRQEIANYLERRFQLTYSPKDQIVCTSGGSEAIDSVLRTFINDGDEVILPQPAYIAYEPCIALAGGVVKPIELKEEHGFKLKKEDLEQAITAKSKILFINFPSNPTGGVMSKEDYLELVPIIKKHNLIVITDEIYAELNYQEKQFSIAQIEEIKEQVIYISGFSKAYSMTGWRLGYICANSTWMKGISKVHQYAVMCPATISQYAGIVALRNCDEEVERMKESFEQRRNFIVQGLNELGLPCHSPQGAFYVFPSITSLGMSSEDFCTKLLEEEKVAVVPGHVFGNAGEGYIRISYAYSIEEIKEALGRIQRFVKKHQK